MNKKIFPSFGKRRKFTKLDYREKKYQNPFFQNKKSSFKKIDLKHFFALIKSRLTIIGISIIIILGVYLFFFSSLFEIKKTNLSGLSRIEEKEILNLINIQKEKNFLLLFKQKNLLILNKDQLAENFEKKYEFAKIEIEKKFPNTLNIKIQEKSLALIWLEEGIYYNTDIDGRIISEVSPLDISKDIYPIIENKTEQNIENYQINFDKQKIDYALDLFSEFIIDVPDIKLEKIIFDKDIDAIKIRVAGGPEIYFNLQEDLNKQINKLITIKNEILKNDFYQKTYIDLRYGERVYYR